METVNSRTFGQILTRWRSEVLYFVLKHKISCSNQRCVWRDSAVNLPRQKLIKRMNQAMHEQLVSACERKRRLNSHPLKWDAEKQLENKAGKHPSGWVKTSRDSLLGVSDSCRLTVITGTERFNIKYVFSHSKECNALARRFFLNKFQNCKNNHSILRQATKIWGYQKGVAFFKKYRTADRAI